MTNPARLEEIIQVRNAILGSGETTSEIRGLMEEIGFQTSLLALHAALATAGERARLQTPDSQAPAAVRSRGDLI